jgi:hypothetical protein
MKDIWNDLHTLRPGIALRVPDAKECGRIEASSGTTSALPSECGYESGAIIPAGVWQNLSSSNRRILCEGGVNSGDIAEVRLVTVHSEVLAPFQELRQCAIQCGVDEVRRLVGHPSFRRPMLSLAKFARNQFNLRIPVDSDQILGGIRVNMPNLRTVTVSPHSGKFVGLHVDNWSQLPLPQRHLGPARICVNLGGESRYFLFVNLPVVQILAAECTAPNRANRTTSAIAHGARPIFEPGLSCTAVGRALMRASPRYPVIRLRIDPGEAYIAPTENLIHDGSSVQTRTADLALSIRENESLLVTTS